ncbi:MAG: BamA/TamA family outer membrane protein, partial [Gemmatimonadetes bacterium]|nr:BamA/TamA family outer membrane protein [Gemmatimonadota bacterium]
MSKTFVVTGGWGVLLGVLLLISDAWGDVERPQRSITYRELAEPRIAGIHFEHQQEKPFGNPQVRAGLQTQIGKRFQRRHFRSDMTTVTNLYRAAGYMDVQIVERRFTLDPDDRLHIYLRIASGEQWRVGAVLMELADIATIDEAALQERIRVERGKVFRYGRVLEDERRLLTMLNTTGHPHAIVQNRIDFDRSRREANVIFEITAGRRMVFGAVEVEPDSLQTSRSLISRQLTFSEGDLYDPEHLRRSRSNLARTGLFRSVIVATPVESETDSVQRVILRLQERPYLHVESRAYASTEDLGLTGNVEHRNFLGRGNRIGADASFGRPLQGITLYLTERNLFDSPADLTLSAGVTDEFGRIKVFADPDDPRQFDLLTSQHAPALVRQAFLGDSTAAAYVARGSYDYPSVERLWKLDATLGRNWQSRSGAVRYLTQLSMDWTQSRQRPVVEQTIKFSGRQDSALAFLDSAAYDSVVTWPHLKQDFEVDRQWADILTNEARALNFRLDMQRDTRDHPIMARSGAFVRAEALFAVEFGGATTRVLDGLVEARHYQPLGSHFVWAQAVTWVMTGAIRRDRQLPQAYWKSFGGDGSV